MPRIVYTESDYITTVKLNWDIQLGKPEQCIIILHNVEMEV